MIKNVTDDGAGELEAMDKKGIDLLATLVYQFVADSEIEDAGSPDRGGLALYEVRAAWLTPEQFDALANAKALPHRTWITVKGVGEVYITSHHRAARPTYKSDVYVRVWQKREV